MSNSRGKSLFPADTARFLALEVPVGESMKRQVLGTVIPKVNTSNPFEVYSPWAPRLSKDEQKELESIQAKLWSAESSTVTLKDTSFDRSRYFQTGAETQITDLFRASISKAKGQEVHIKAGVAKRYSIIAPGQAAPEWLFSNKVWMNQLQHMYSHRLSDTTYPQKDLALVTGVWTCKGLQVSWKREAGKQYDANFRIDPAGIAQQAVAGPAIPVKLDVILKVDRGRSSDSEVIATCEEEIIFALAYHNLHLDFAQRDQVSRSWLLFGMKRTSKQDTTEIIRCELGKPIRGEGYDSYAGDTKAEEADSEFYYREPQYATLRLTKSNDSYTVEDE